MQPDKVSNYWLSISPSVSVALLTVWSLSLYISPISHSCLCHHSCHFSVFLLSPWQSFSYPFLSLLTYTLRQWLKTSTFRLHLQQKQIFPCPSAFWQTVQLCLLSVWSENWIRICNQDKLSQNASKSARSGKFVILMIPTSLQAGTKYIIPS